MNDWLFLKNIAQSNNGFLIAKPPAEPEGAGGATSGASVSTRSVLKRYPVDGISLFMLKEANPNIKVYRAITTRQSIHLTGIFELSRALDALPDSKDERVMARREDLTSRLTRQQQEHDRLQVERDVEMNAIVTGFISATGNNPEKSVSQTFKELVAQTKTRCIGFDGSSVDQ